MPEVQGNLQLSDANPAFDGEHGLVGQSFLQAYGTGLSPAELAALQAYRTNKTTRSRTLGAVDGAFGEAIRAAKHHYPDTHPGKKFKVAMFRRALNRAGCWIGKTKLNDYFKIPYTPLGAGAVGPALVPAVEVPQPQPAPQPAPQPPAAPAQVERPVYLVCHTDGGQVFHLDVRTNQVEHDPDVANGIFVPQQQQQQDPAVEPAPARPVYLVTSTADDRCVYLDVLNGFVVVQEPDRVNGLFLADQVTVTLGKMFDGLKGDWAKKMFERMGKFQDGRVWRAAFGSALPILCPTSTADDMYPWLQRAEEVCRVIEAVNAATSKWDTGLRADRTKACKISSTEAYLRYLLMAMRGFSLSARDFQAAASRSAIKTTQLAIKSISARSAAEPDNPDEVEYQIDFIADGLVALDLSETKTDAHRLLSAWCFKGMLPSHTSVDGVKTVEQNIPHRPAVLRKMYMISRAAMDAKFPPGSPDIDQNAESYLIVDNDETLWLNVSLKNSNKKGRKEEKMCPELVTAVRARFGCAADGGHGLLEVLLDGECKALFPGTEPADDPSLPPVLDSWEFLTLFQDLFPNHSFKPLFRHARHAYVTYRHNAMDINEREDWLQAQRLADAMDHDVAVAISTYRDRSPPEEDGDVDDG